MKTIIEMLIATFAVLGQEVTDIGVKTIAQDLAGYDVQAVAMALTRCRKELRRVTLSDIIERIPGEHPGPEEAWGMVSATLNNEDVSIAWTTPMRLAYGSAYNLAADPVAARMAFKEAYQRHVSEARAVGEPPVWEPSLGRDSGSREDVIERVKSLNLLTQQSLKLLEAKHDAVEA